MAQPDPPSSLFNRQQLEILTRAASLSSGCALVFTGEQRGLLNNLGLNASQIDALHILIPTSQRLLADSATLQDVRDELLALEAAACKLQSALARLSAAQGGAAAEAFSRISYSSIGDTELFDTLGRGLRTLHERVQQASEGLGSSQRRPREMAWLVVGMLHLALQESQADPVRFKPSSAASSAFRQVAGVLFDAALGLDGSDPERAIKAYLRWNKAHTAQLGR